MSMNSNGEQVIVTLAVRGAALHTLGYSRLRAANDACRYPKQPPANSSTGLSRQHRIRAQLIQKCLIHRTKPVRACSWH